MDGVWDVATGRQIEGPGPNPKGSPVALDLNNDGKIGTTGNSTAKDQANPSEIGSTVQFDIDADGKKDTIEWMNGDGDGLLVDTSKIKDSGIDGDALFGDLAGQFNNGYKSNGITRQQQGWQPIRQ